MDIPFFVEIPRYVVTLWFISCIVGMQNVFESPKSPFVTDVRLLLTIVRYNGIPSMEQRYAKKNDMQEQKHPRSSTYPLKIPSPHQNQS